MVKRLLSTTSSYRFLATGTSPAGAVVAKLIDTVSDNCAVSSTRCTQPEGSTFALGSDPFTCTATDPSSNTSSCSSQVTVVDTTAPIINSIVPDPGTLWAPNHTLVPVSITARATDVCDAAPKCQIVSVTSNEPVLAAGSGNTSPDWVINDPGPKASPAVFGGATARRARGRRYWTDLYGQCFVRRRLGQHDARQHNSERFSRPGNLICGARSGTASSRAESVFGLDDA
jgi:HYR domain